MFAPVPFLGQVRLRPPSMGCGGGYIPAPEEPVREETHQMGCDLHGQHYVEGCSKCRRRKRKDWTYPYGPGSEMIGTHRTERHGRMAGRILGQNAICTLNPPVLTPDTNCQKTAAGDVICSNGVIYAGTCPNAPAVNYPGVAPVTPGTTTPQTPPYKSAADAAATGAATPAAGAAPAASDSTVPLVVGGAAVLLLAVFVLAT